MILVKWGNQLKLQSERVLFLILQDKRKRMNPALHFALALLLACLPLFGQGQIFSEDFGSSFSTTYLGAPNWSSCLSKTGNSSTGSCAGFPDYGVYLSNGESITTNQISIPATGYCLNFEYAFGGSSNFPLVEIGTGGAFCFSSMTWTPLATLSQANSCTSISQSLDAYAGQSVWIRFTAGSSFTSWYIDDITVDLGACGGGGGGGGCTTTFQDDFSDGSINGPEWTTVSSAFTSSFGPCTGGDSRAYFSTFSSPAEVISRSIDLTGATTAQLDMDYLMAASAFAFQCATIEVSTNAGSTWNNTGASYTDPDGTCQHLTVDLSAYVGSAIQIRIRRASTSTTFYFDNVEVCSDGGALSNFKWADNFNDNDLVLDFAGNDGDEDCPSCGPWLLGGGASLDLVPSGAWNGNSVETEAFPQNMANVYYARLDRNEWIESPVMDLSAMEGFKISFYAKSSSPGTGGGDQWSFSDRLRLQIWDGSAWQTVQSLRDDLSATWNGSDDYISDGLPFNYYCFTAYKSTSSPGNYYYTGAPHVDPAWFHSGFKFRVLFEGGFSGAPFAWVDDFTFRADADGYSTMIPCGLSFWNEPAATAYGQDLGTTGNTNAEKGVELELDNSINVPPNWLTEADDGDVVSQTFGPGEAERVVFCVLSEQEIDFAFPRVHFYAPSMGWQSSVMQKDNTYNGPGWRYYGIEYISCDLAGGSIAEPTDQYRYYFSFEYGNEFIPVFYHLNSTGIEVGGGATLVAETFDAPDVNASCGPLAAEDLVLSGKWNGNARMLTWRLGDGEEGLERFVLERSLDAASFEPVVRTRELKYEDEEAIGNAGALWYRVRGFDPDGGEALSNAVLLVKDEAENSWGGYVYPNPSEGEFSMRIVSEYAGEGMLVLLNMQGQEVFVGPVGIEEGVSALKKEFPGLSSGMYLWNLKMSERVLRGKWVKR